MRSRHAQRRQTGDKRRAKSVTNQHENHQHINHHHYHRHHRHYQHQNDHMGISLLIKTQSKESSTKEHKHGLYAANHWHQDASYTWIVPTQWDDKISLWELKMLRLSVCNLIKRFWYTLKRDSGDIILKINSWILKLLSKKSPKFQSFTFRAGKKGSNVC